MKNVKLFSALALAAFATVVATNSTSAVMTATTQGDIEFKASTTAVLPPSVTDPNVDLPDVIFPGGQKPSPVTPGVVTPTEPEYPNEVIPAPAGDLALVEVPKPFDFDVNEVEGEILLDSNVHSFKQIEGVRDWSQYVQAVQVQDGRISGNDWHLTAKLTGFAKLQGATITIENTTVVLDKGAAAKGKGVDANGVFTISDTDSSFLKANPTAKGYTSQTWAKAEDVKFNVAGNEITEGKHTGNVEWTLSSQPEA